MLSDTERVKLQEWQAPHRLEDPLADQLGETWERGTPQNATAEWKSSTEIWKALPNRGDKSPDVKEVRAVGVILSSPNAPGGHGPWKSRILDGRKLYLCSPKTPKVVEETDTDMNALLSSLGKKDSDRNPN